MKISIQNGLKLKYNLSKDRPKPHTQLSLPNWKQESVSECLCEPSQIVIEAAISKELFSLHGTVEEINRPLVEIIFTTIERGQVHRNI